MGSVSNPAPASTVADLGSEAGNTTTTPLAAAATFTGTGERSADLGVIVSCQASAAGTLYFEFSNDNENWSTFPTAGFTISAGIHAFHTAIKGPRYFRVRLVNGGVEQTYLRLYAYFGEYGQGNLPRNAAIGRDADAHVVRIIEPSLEIAEGLVTGVTADTKFGYNGAVEAAGEDIWGGGGLYTGQPVGGEAETVDVIAANENDEAEGTGARTIEISGLDASWESQSEVITLHESGTTVSVNKWLRVFRASVLTAGSGAANAGLITIRHTTTEANVFEVLLVGLNQSLVGAVTVPAGFQLYIEAFTLAIARDKGAEGGGIYSLRVRPFGGVYNALRYEAVTTASPVVQTLDHSPLVIPEKADIKFTLESVSDVGTFGSCRLDYLLVEN